MHYIAVGRAWSCLKVFAGTLEAVPSALLQSYASLCQEQVGHLAGGQGAFGIAGLRTSTIVVPFKGFKENM